MMTETNITCIAGVEVFNLGTGNATSVLEIIKTFEDSTGIPLRSVVSGMGVWCTNWQQVPQVVLTEFGSFYQRERVYLRSITQENPVAVSSTFNEI